MTKSQYNKMNALKAAVCFAGYGIYGLIYDIYIALQWQQNLPFLSLVIWLLYLGLAVLLYLEHRKGVAVIFGLWTLLSGCNMISYFQVFQMAAFLAYGLVAAFTVLLIMSERRKPRFTQYVSNYWYAPAVLMLASKLIVWFSAGYFTYFNIAWQYILQSLVECAGVLFTLLWIKVALDSAEREREDLRWPE